FTLAHGAWATGPATAAACIAKICHMPFSFGGHAYDIYRFGGDPFLEDKLRFCAFVHTTTASNVKYLQERASKDQLQTVLARRGLIALPDIRPKELKEGEPIQLISVGRLVEKKGQALLFKACALLKEREIPFHLKLIGDGPLRQELEALCDALNLCDEIKITGALKPSAVQELYRNSHIFIHSGVVDSQGDRDGVPNVIPEAFSHNLAVVGSMTEGVMEAVQHEITGLTVDPTKPQHIADAVERLTKDANLRKRLGQNGRKWVMENFIASKNTAILADAMRAACNKTEYAGLRLTSQT
ncbi:MAG: glycosyltransferase family 4 protein, partial [Verrucomicrobiota bacterium]